MRGNSRVRPFFFYSIRQKIFDSTPSKGPRTFAVTVRMTVVSHRSHAIFSPLTATRRYFRCKDWRVTHVVLRRHLVKYLTACQQLAHLLTGSLIADLWAFIPSITNNGIDDLCVLAGKFGAYSRPSWRVHGRYCSGQLLNACTNLDRHR